MVTIIKYVRFFPRISWAHLIFGVILSFASHSLNASHRFPGIYMGGAGGFVFGNGSALTHTQTTFEKRNMAGHAFSGDVFAGYGTGFGPVYLGAEGNIGFQRMSGISHDNPTVLINTSFRLTLKNTYMLALRLGFICQEKYLVYARLGWSLGTWEGVFQDANPVATQSRTLYRPGFVAGVGMDVPFHKQWSWGCDFNYTAYASFKIPFAPPIIPGYINATPRVATFLLRVQYTF